MRAITGNFNITRHKFTIVIQNCVWHRNIRWNRKLEIFRTVWFCHSDIIADGCTGRMRSGIHEFTFPTVDIRPGGVGGIYLCFKLIRRIGVSFVNSIVVRFSTAVISDIRNQRIVVTIEVQNHIFDFHYLEFRFKEANVVKFPDCIFSNIKVGIDS